MDQPIGKMCWLICGSISSLWSIWASHIRIILWSFVWDQEQRQLWEDLENSHSAHCETYFSGEKFEKNEKTTLVSISAHVYLRDVNVT